MVSVDRGTCSKLIQRVVEQFTTDPVLKAVFGKNWDIPYDLPGFNQPTESTPFGIRLDISNNSEGDGWYSVDKHQAALQFDFSIWLPGNNLGKYNALDTCDVWDAIVDVCYSPDKSKRDAFRIELQGMGAKTGEFQIGQPAVSLMGKDGKITNLGSVRLTYKRALNRNINDED